MCLAPSSNVEFASGRSSLLPLKSLFDVLDAHQFRTKELDNDRIVFGRKLVCYSLNSHAHFFALDRAQLVVLHAFGFELNQGLNVFLTVDFRW